MKNKLNNVSSYLLFSFMALALGLLLPACKKTALSGPVITAVRNYVASPGDTILTSAVANGQYVVIIGQNLQEALQITFDGVPATFNNALFSQNSVVVPIPAIVFSQIDTNKLYTIQYTTTTGTTIFSFKLGPAKPVISGISNVFAKSGDSVFIFGTNLVLIQNFSYGGTKINSFKSSLNGDSLGFVMPSPVPVSGQVLITSKAGTAIFKIDGKPIIANVSNENAIPGDSVFIYGSYFKNVQTFSFAGKTITSFLASITGDTLAFVMPTLSQSGPVSITTPFGTTTTVYNVNDITTGAISNFEWGGVFNWQWWGGANLSSGVADFPGNPGQYLTLKTSPLSVGEGNPYSSYSLLMNAAQWVPLANMNDSIQKWAFKFEVSIPQPWNGGSMVVTSSDPTFIARWEPWQISLTKTATFTTKGWRTVTIPFTQFRSTDTKLGDGEGASMTQFNNLLGSTGNSQCKMYLHNYGTSTTTTGFYGAFDNIRVVKIK